MDTEKKVAIKFLLSNGQAGILIGSGGKSIVELSELIPGARVNVSGQQDVYPGTNDRVVLISGDLDSVLQAQILVWELLTLQEQTPSSSTKEGSRAFVWSPRAAAENLGSSTGAHVEAKITIPAAAAGAVIGKGGSNMRNIVEDSGARVNMAGKDEALLTFERVISISGQTNQCVRATNMIVNLLHEQDEVAPFQNRGTSYSSQPFGGYSGSTRDSGGVRTYEGGARRGGDRPLGDRRDNRRRVGEHGDGDESPEILSTITLSVPNELVGNIMGRNGTTLREIIALSGARVTVSKREERGAGTNRTVTITGSPAATQSAHLFVTQRLETPANSPPIPPRRGGRGVTV